MFFMKNYGVILASGTGNRYGNDLPKQFNKLAGKTILEHTIDVFEANDNIDEIIIVITPKFRYLCENILIKNNYKKVCKLLNGGDTRQQSSEIAVESIQDDDDTKVIIHDAARPFITHRIINDCVKALDKYDAVDVAIPAIDTIIETDNEIVKNIPNRANLQYGQTPQCFKLGVIKKAHQLARKDDTNFTDDCGIVVKYSLAQVYVIPGDINNIKITYPVDIYIADKLFQLKHTDIYDENIKIENLKDKIIVIFGGNSGIGQHIDIKLKQYGARTYALSRSNGCDITNYANIASELNKIYTKHGKIDYIINSAGVLNIGKLIDRKIQDIIQDININYVGNINVAHASIPYLKKSRGGLLLFTSSSYTRGRALYSTYSSAKAAIVNLVQALAEELYEDGVKVNAINPERTATPMRFNAFGEEPAETLCQPERVADFSIKTLITNITGQVIDVKRR